MLKEDVYSLGDPGTFDPDDKDDPQYYIARISHEMSKTLYNLQEAGFSFNQMENSDFSAFEDAFDTYSGLVQTWFDTAVQDSKDGDPIAAVPAIPDLTTIIPWLAGNPWLTFLVRTAINFGLLWLRKQLDSDTDAKEITAVLRKALIGVNGEEEEYPLMELLAAIPIQVILSKHDYKDDLLFSASTT